MRKRVKRKPPMKRPVRLPESMAFWQGIYNALSAQCGNPAVMSVCTDMPSELLKTSISAPFGLAVGRMTDGSATQSDFWVFTQTIYYSLYLVGYLKSDEPVRMSDDDQRTLYYLELDALEVRIMTEFTELISSIGERQKKTGRYGLSGDELRAAQEFQRMLNDVLSWCSVRSVYHSSSRCVQSLGKVEHSILKRKFYERLP